MKFILGKKMQMSQLFEEDGTVIPVTVVLVESMKVAQIKTKEKDGYESIKFSSGSKKKTGQARYLRESRGAREVQVGETVDVSIFNPGDKVKVTGISKGKGFQGAVKRHGFHGMPASHGHHHVLRHVGSIGQRFPQHTLKGMRMAGRMGGEKTTVRGLKIIRVDKENNLLAIKGAVPGRKGTLLEIRSI